MTANQATRTGKRRMSLWLMAACLCLAVVIAYSNSFSGVLVLDDLVNVIRNPSIRSLSPIGKALCAPRGAPVAGRPLVNLSFAVNYAISGLATWSYHAVNLLIHVLSALTLFGIARRTLESGEMRKLFGRDSLWLAFLTTLLWALHPLHTQAVTYISQRCESLVSLFLLLTLYCAIKGWEAGGRSSRRALWHVLAGLSCIAGVYVKEIIVAAPFLVFIYDAVFVHRGARKSLVESPLLYTGMAVSLILLAFLLAGGATYSAIEGQTLTSLQYLLAQPPVIAHYLALAIWPGPLCLDYSMPLPPLTQTLFYGAPLLAAALATVWALWRKHPAGFAGAWFFFILAPSSSVIALNTLAFEHRMYLPLAAVIWVLVLGGYGAARRFVDKHPGSAPGLGRWGRRGAVALVLIAALALGARTYARNEDYKDEVRLWEDTLQKLPDNFRAHINLGKALNARGRRLEAIVHFQKASGCNPCLAIAQNNLGSALAKEGRLAEALAVLQESVRIKPDYHVAHLNLGNVLRLMGRPDQAMGEYEQSLRCAPDYVQAHLNLGALLAAMGRKNEAARHFQAVLQMEPQNAVAANQLKSL